MAPLLLRVVLDGGVIMQTSFDTSDTVEQATQILKKTVFLPNRDKEYALFLRFADNDLSGIWLDDSRTLDYYMLRDGDVLHYISSTNKAQASEVVPSGTQAESKMSIKVSPEEMPTLAKADQETNEIPCRSAAEVSESLITRTSEEVVASNKSEADTFQTLAVAEETPNSSLLTPTLDSNVEDKQLMEKNLPIPRRLEDHERTQNEGHNSRRPSLKKRTSQLVKRALPSRKKSDELDAQKVDHLVIHQQMTQKDGAKVQQHLCKQLAELYAAVAVFDGTRIDTAAVIKIKELMLLIARDARTLSSKMDTEEQVALLEQIRDLGDASNKIYEYVNNAKVLIPMQEASCSNDLLSVVIQLNNASALVESYLMPSKQHKKMLTNKQLMKKSMEKLVQACNSLQVTAELPEKRISRLLAVSAAHAKESLVATRKLLDEPIVFQLPKKEDLERIQQQLYRRLAQLSAAVATLDCSVNAVGGIRNYSEAIKNVNAVMDLTPLVVKDAKKLCSTTVEPQKSSLLHLIMKLCGTCSDICDNIESQQGLTEAAERFNLTSQKLVSCTNTSPNIKKETNITTLTASAHKQALLIASTLQCTAEHAESSAAAVFLSKGAVIVVAANRLKVIAQILAPVVKDQNNSHELLCAVTALRQVSVLPERNTLPKQEQQKLINYQQQLRKSLDQLVIACIKDNIDNIPKDPSNKDNEKQENQMEETKSNQSINQKENLNKMPIDVMSELQNKVKGNKDDIIPDEDEIRQKEVINNATKINDLLKADAVDITQIVNSTNEHTPATPELELIENQKKMPCLFMSELQNKIKTGIKLDTVEVRQLMTQSINVNETNNNQVIPQQLENATEVTTKTEDKLSPKINRVMMPHTVMMELHNKIKAEPKDVEEPKEETDHQNDAHIVNDIFIDKQLNQVLNDNKNQQTMPEIVATMKQNQEKMPNVIMSEMKSKLRTEPKDVEEPKEETDHQNDAHIVNDIFIDKQLNQDSKNQQIMPEMAATMKENQEKIPNVIMSELKSKLRTAPPVPARGFPGDKLIILPSQQYQDKKSPPIPLKPVRNNTLIMNTKLVNKTNTETEPIVVTIKNDIDPVQLNTETESNVITVKTSIDSVKLEENLTFVTVKTNIDQVKLLEGNMNPNTTTIEPGSITKEAVKFNPDTQPNIITIKTNIDNTIIKLETPDSEANNSNLEPYKLGSRPNNINIEKLKFDKPEKVDDVPTDMDTEMKPKLPRKPIIVTTKLNDKFKEYIVEESEGEKIEKMVKAEDNLTRARNALQELVSLDSDPVCQTTSETSSQSASQSSQVEHLHVELQQLEHLQVVQRDGSGGEGKIEEPVVPPRDRTVLENAVVKRYKMKTALQELQSSLLQASICRNGPMDSENK